VLVAQGVPGLFGAVLPPHATKLSDHYYTDIAQPWRLRLVMVEAMACGIRVLAFHRGSASEIIDQGVTGAV
jgi:glycosyltransferase involved in cell wall biosynthesis